jgi:hypothetical protein
VGRPADEGGVAGGVLALGRVGGGLVGRRTGGDVTGVSNWEGLLSAPLTIPP